MAKRKSLKDRASNFQPTVEDQEKALEKLESKKEEKDTIRVSVDFPRGLYETMHKDTKNMGQTKKGLIIHLVREYYKDKGL